MNTYNFIVTYTNDKRAVEVKARDLEEAEFLLLQRAKKALMQIASFKLTDVKTVKDKEWKEMYPNGFDLTDDKEEYEEWKADNVLMNADATFSTQDAQYRNRLVNEQALYTYFKKEFRS